ncbi:MAG: pilus assembly protein PilM [Candidatus Cloacimonetes bacterium]|nr:pilus assembly protein PilM [Candidatus Cloacimonadota bacterium]
MAKKHKVKRFKESVGLDIGSHSIKLVHLKRMHDGFKLLNYAIKPTIPDGVEYSISDLRKDRFPTSLIDIFKSLRMKPRSIKRLVSSIGGDNTSLKQIKTIFLPEEELESALFFEAKKHLPISGGEMLLDFQVLNVEEKTNNMNILLAASTKSMLSEHTDILQQAGVAPGLVDVESLAIANCYALNTLSEEGTHIILNIGAHKTNMIIYGANAKFFARDIPWGGFHMTRDIMRQRDISFEDAERFKIEHGLGDEAQETESTGAVLDIAEKSTVEQIAVEVRRSLRFYVKEAGNSDFRKVLLVGGSAKISGLPEYLEKAINIPTEVFNPFVNLEMPDKFRDTQDPQLALAIGLAMRPE